LRHLATAAVAAGLAAGTLVATVATASADPSSPFATLVGSVDSSGASATVVGTPVPSAHENVLVRLTQSGSSKLQFGFGEVNPADVGSGDVIWTHGPYLNAGDIPSLSAQDFDAVNGASFSAEYIDEPTAPTSYSGTSSTASDDSELSFFTPGTAPYIASVSVSGGAIQVSGGAASQVFEDAGQYSLGTISDGSGAITVAPVAGPQAQWTISISPEPITITAPQFNKAWSQPGVINTLHFSMDGATNLTAQIEDASGTVVRTLASGLPEGAGAHTLVWDGRDSSGNSVPTGTYTAKLTSDDPVGNVSNASATLGIDSTPPTVSLANSTPRPTQAIVVRFADHGSGIVSGSIAVDGGHKQVLGQGEKVLSYGPRHWTPGHHEVVAVATDRAGNRTARTLSFRVKSGARPADSTSSCRSATSYIKNLRITTNRSGDTNRCFVARFVAKAAVFAGNPRFRLSGNYYTEGEWSASFKNLPHKPHQEQLACSVHQETGLGSPIGHTVVTFIQQNGAD
jgi:hypothetical protein